MRLRRVPSGAVKGRLRRPTVAEMLALDPTEAIRSAEIPAVVREHFDVVEERPLGGALAHLALDDIAQNFDPADPEARSALERLFALEDEAMADGRIGSDFAAFTAVPKRWAFGAALRRFAGRAPTARPPAQARDAAMEEELPFDEAWYLDAYPDVRDGVADGVHESGRDHWLRFGKAEGRLPSGGSRPAG